MAERTLDFDRQTALQQMPRPVRPAFQALWQLDLAMADVVATTTEPGLGAIRLAWWRERLDELDTNRSPPSEPRLMAIAQDVLPHGVSGHALSGLEDAWLPLLGPFPWGDDVAAGLRLRGQILFRAGAQLLQGDPQDTEAAGALWSLVDGARHCSDIYSRIALMQEARKAIAQLPRERPPKSLRRLTGLAAVAAHDAIRNKPLDLPYEDVGRGIAALLHYCRGTLPRG
ncbi:MAG: squalene/phytoene synthase family protein [Sphingomicrobium sp.]